MLDHAPTAAVGPSSPISHGAPIEPHDHEMFIKTNNGDTTQHQREASITARHNVTIAN